MKENMSNKPMTATERKELRRIIAARFALLETELKSRRNAIKIRIENEMRDSKAKDIAAFEERIKELTTDAQALNEKSEKLFAEICKAGLTPIPLRHRNSSYKNNSWQFASDLMTINIIRKLDIANIDNNVQEATKQLLNEHGAAKLDLHKMQLQIEEELALGTIVSEEAQAFLTRIPNADKLLPSPDNIEVPALPATK